MATDPNDVINQFVAALERLESRLGQSASRVQGTVDAYSQLRSATSQMTQAGRATAEAMRGMTRDTNAGRSAIQAKARFERTVTGELSQLSKAVARGSLTHAEGDEAFRQMIASVRQNADLSATQRRDLMQTLILERRRQDSLQRGVVMQENFADAMQRYGINAVGKGLQSMASAYQGGGVQISNFAGKAGIQGASLGVQVLGKALRGVGNALGGIGGLGKVAGPIGAGLGAGLDIIADKAEKILVPVFEFLSTEFNRQLKSFQAMSSAGAVFGTGILGMNEAAANAGITTENLAVVLKNNSEDIAKTGLGMAEGTRMIGRIGKDLRDSGVSQRLAQLGYTAEEITDMVAQTAGQMRMGGADATDKQIAETTAAYAKDLRTLQAITGEDVRQKEKEAKARNNTLAFNQKLDGMDAKQRTNIHAAMGQLTEREQALLREKIINNGQAFTKESLMYESMVEGTTEKMDGLYKAWEQGNLDVDAVTKAQTEYAEIQRRSITSQKELALAAELGVGFATGVGKDMNDSYNKSVKFDPGNVQKIRDEVDLAYSEKVNAVTKTMGNYEIATKAVEAQLQQLVGESGALTLFGEYIGKVNKGVFEFGQWLNRFMHNPSGAVEQILPESLQERNRQTIPERSMPQVDPNTGLPFLGTTDRPMTVNDPALIEALRNTRPGPGPGSEQNVERFASGGITDYPASGRLAMLHGREAVIPLPSGLRAEDLADVFKSLKEGLTDTEQQVLRSKLDDASQLMTKDTMPSESRIAGIEDMVQQLFELNTSMNTLNDHMRDVSNHTERTARGVA